MYRKRLIHKTLVRIGRVVGNPVLSTVYSFYIIVSFYKVLCYGLDLFYLEDVI
jgi:hypothetical protein